MKTLYLLRHAKSSWDDSDLDDFSRPLSERGVKDAPKMGRRLKEQGAIPDTIYSSPAERALATAKIVAGVLDFPLNAIHTDRKLYHADEEALLKFLCKLPDQFDHVMLVGHNPGLTAFANELLNESIDNIPTTGVIGATLGINSWQEAKWKSGKLLFFDFPKRKE